MNNLKLNYELEITQRLHTIYLKTSMTPQEAYRKTLYENIKIQELEEIISKDPEYSYWYSLNVIQGPFEKGHCIIFYSDCKDNYLDFLKSIKYNMINIGEWLI